MKDHPGHVTRPGNPRVTESHSDYFLLDHQSSSKYSALSTNICASVSTGSSCGLPASNLKVHAINVARLPFCVSRENTHASCNFPMISFRLALALSLNRKQKRRLTTGRLIKPGCGDIQLSAYSRSCLWVLVGTSRDSVPLPWQLWTPLIK